MKGYCTSIMIAMLTTTTASAQARSTIATDSAEGGSSERTRLVPSTSGVGSKSLGATTLAKKSEGYLQCVPYARDLSGIQIRGDAHTWWKQAAGRYARGTKPKVGAVMAFQPHGNSRLGHVAAVSRIVDTRTILISHANWSDRGKIEKNVTAIDVSPRNDWSQVRVWYAPIHNLGGSRWPITGFIYNSKPGKNEKIERSLTSEARTTKTSAAPTKVKRRAKDIIGAIIAGSDW